jgi:poly(3-hydroxybutyrate) depolymerase
MKKALLAATAALAMAGCTTPSQQPPSSASPQAVAPNPNLFVQGIPAVPQALADSVARYADFRGHGFVDWHPTRREMLVSHRLRGKSTAQLFRLASPLGALEPLTDLPEPITSGSYEPREGRYLVYPRARGGDEAFQIWRLDLDTRQHTQLTDPAYRHATQRWLKKGERSRLIIGSVPLDRTAAGGTRASIDTRLSIVDPLAPERTQLLATLPGGGWGVADVSSDETQALLSRYVSATVSEVWLLDLRSGERRRVLPAAGSTTTATHAEARFGPGGQMLLAISDADGEFRELGAFALDGTPRQRWTRHIPWDFNGLSFTEDRRLIAAQANEDGTDSLRLFDSTTGTELPRPAMPAGNLGTARFHPQRAEIAFSISSAQGPGQLYTLDTASGRVEPWTRAESAAGIDTAAFTPQRLVRWPSFDGRTISGWLSAPPAARFPGKRPVLIDIHGGPEGQSQSGFLGRYQYLVQELGVAIVRPNVRGSSGYGKTFISLDNGVKREDSVKDIGALLDWIAQQPDLDPARVVVTGGSYGGYMSLASAVHYSSRLAGAIDIVGISHFVTFLESTESYRRDLRRVEYGDERDPAMREFLHRISPLTNAERITKPLFVIQGRNDPRVPYTEAEQIVAKARANGTPVWYLRAENEGHGFERRENAEFQFLAMVMFLRQTMKL